MLTKYSSLVQSLFPVLDSELPLFSGMAISAFILYSLVTQSWLVMEHIKSVVLSSKSAALFLSVNVPVIPAIPGISSPSESLFINVQLPAIFPTNSQGPSFLTVTVISRDLSASSGSRFPLFVS